jgi:hypothetical protein
MDEEPQLQLYGNSVRRKNIFGAMKDEASGKFSRRTYNMRNLDGYRSL